MSRKDKKRLRKLKQVKIPKELIWKLTRAVTRIYNKDTGKHFACRRCGKKGCVGFDNVIVYCDRCRYRDSCLREDPIKLICC